MRDDLISVFDVETTGFDPDTDDIIEIGIVTCDLEGETVEEWGALVQRDHIPDDVSELTGLTAEQLMEHGRPWEKVRDLASRRLNRVKHWCAYNFGFDAGFVGTHMPSCDVDAHKKIDPLEIVYNYVPPDELKKKRRNLETVCASFGVDLTAAHRAVHDASATKDVLFRLMDAIDLTLDDILSDRRTTLGRFGHGKDPFVALYQGRPRSYSQYRRG